MEQKCEKSQRHFYPHSHSSLSPARLRTLPPSTDPLITHTREHILPFNQKPKTSLKKYLLTPSVNGGNKHTYLSATFHARALAILAT